jgi:hypothetical protein
MDYRGLMRRKMLADIYDKMSDDDKRTFVQLTMQDKDHKEIMQALEELKIKADKNHHSFSLDFAANVLGNGAWDALLFLGKSLFRKL